MIYSNASSTQQPNCSTENTPGDLDRNVAAVVFEILVLSAIFIFSTVGNTMVLYVIGVHLKFKTITNAFIATLSISDLAVTLICMPMTLVTVGTYNWVFQEGGCIANETLTSVFTFTSSLMLACISLDRYIVVVRLPQKPISMKIACTVIFSCWLIALAFSLPWHLTSNRPARSLHKSGFYHCMYTFHAQSSNMGTAYSVVVIVIFYIVPCVCMMFSSGCLYKIIQQNQNRIKPSSLNASQLRFSGEMRTAKTVVIMVLVFVGCRMLYPMMGLFTAILGNEFTPTMDTVALWCSWCQCAINPVIYALRNPTVAQILHVRRKTPGYQPENQPSSPGLVSNFSDALCGFGTGNRQSKYRASNASIAPSEFLEIYANSGRNWRSDSIPTVMNFQTERKNSDLSTITATTMTSAM